MNGRQRTLSFVLALLVFGLFATTACVKDQGATTDPALLGRIAAEVETAPHQMDEILSRHGHTRESFEAAIRNLAEDPEKVAKYTASYERNK
jgi:hypothetical protein